MNPVKSIVLILVLFLLIAVPVSLIAQSNVAEIQKVYPGDVGIKGFTLKNDGKIKITGTGAFLYYDGEITYYGWILNSKTRETVWYLDEDKIDDKNFQEFRDGEFYNFDEEISLKKGDYELYFAGMRTGGYNIQNIGGVFNKIFGRRSDRFSRRDMDKLGIKVSGSGGFSAKSGMEAADKMKEKAIVSLTSLRDDEYEKKGFALKNDTKVRIYAIGEGSRSSRDINDYGWIYNVDTHERVWVMESRDTDHAGGAEKNRIIDENITLPKGNYMVYFVTDDSHSFEEWNMFPPEDPQFWGITLWTVNENDMANIVPFEDVEESKAVIELVRMRDNDFESVGMKLNKPMDLRILCLGEGTNHRRGEMSDYGWIIKADTRENVWDMSDIRTEHAGGADKNRMASEVVHFDKGEYIIYYSTDGSHSYRRWNSSAPFEQERWGISLWVTDEKDRSSVSQFDETKYKPENVLAEIVRVRDHESLDESFTLDKDTKIRIYAIGEGDRSEMFDYAWIENEKTGRVVWDMTYRRTDHAGGARKNRLANDIITLPKGKYVVFYETDGSHSFRRWNSTAPNDPERYGVTVMKEK